MGTTRHTIRENLATKDLREAIERCLEWWDRVQTDQNTRVNLHVLTSHSAPLELLATAVASDTRGFSPLGSSRNLTALETLALLRGTECPRDWSVDLNLGATVGYSGVRDVLDCLRQMRPDPVRRCAVSLYVQNIRWPGASTTTAGGFVFDDAKHFGRKIRFSIRAYVDLDVATKADATRALAMISQASALDFSAAKLTRPSRTPSPINDRQAEACLLFDHCIELVSSEFLTAGFDWNTLSGAFPDGGGIARRFEALASGRSADFRWDPIVTQFVRTEFPAFKKVAGIVDDALTFLNPVSESWSLALIIDKHPGLRVGRVFKLRCGAVCRDDSAVIFKRTAPVLRCAGRAYAQLSDSCPEFSFDTVEELDRILASLRNFLDDFLIRMTRRLREDFLPGLAKLETVLPIHGPLTADEALALAQRRLRDSGLETAELWGASLTGTVDALHYREDSCAQCPSDGRLTIQHAWEFTFLAGPSGVVVTVPWAGIIRCCHIGSRAWSVWSEHTSPIPRFRSLNSPALAATAWRVKEHLARRYPAMAPVIGLPRLSSNRWIVQIEFCSALETSGWVRTETEIDATTAEPLAITFDERLPDRPESSVQFVERGPFRFD